MILRGNLNPGSDRMEACTPGGYEELPLYPITINAWELGIVMVSIMRFGNEDTIPRFWKMVVELKKSIEAGDGIVKEFLPDGMVRLTDCDGVVITRPRFPWDILDEG